MTTNYLGAVSSAPIWWIDKGRFGLRCYIGGGNTGLQFTRHDQLWGDKPGLWTVGVTGWTSMRCNAVVDDFGSLVEVRA